MIGDFSIDFDTHNPSLFYRKEGVDNAVNDPTG
jgi:hypothetical protein